MDKETNNDKITLQRKLKIEQCESQMKIIIALVTKM